MPVPNRALVSSTLLLLAAACSGTREPRAAGGAAQAAAPPIAAPQPDRAVPREAVAPAGAATVDPAVRSACDGVASFWRPRDSTTVRVVDTLVAPWTETASRPACFVSVDQAHGMRRDTAATIQADTGARQLGPALALTRGNGPGWIPLYHYSADGPDGTDMGYQRGTVRCLVEESWDGDDDSDSTYVPADWFKEQTTCWVVPGGLTPADTAP